MSCYNTAFDVFLWPYISFYPLHLLFRFPLSVVVLFCLFVWGLFRVCLIYSLSTAPLDFLPIFLLSSLLFLCTLHLFFISSRFWGFFSPFLLIPYQVDKNSQRLLLYIQLTVRESRVGLCSLGCFSTAADSGFKEHLLRMGREEWDSSRGSAVHGQLPIRHSTFATHRMDLC